MDVTVPPIPPAYDDYRRRLQQFIADHKPTLAWKPRTGMRVPDDRAEVEVLRTWVRALYDEGYVLARFREGQSDPFEQRVLEEELARTAIPFVVGNPLVAGAIDSFGTPAQKRTYLPPMARGDHIWTQLFSEPNAGSDLTSLQARGRLDGDHYVVDGQKVWSTWAQWADYGYLLARTEAAPGPRGITAFILDMNGDGIEVRPLREMTGTTDFNEVFLDDVHIPIENVIGNPGDGWRVAQTSLAAERGGVGAGGSGDSVRGLVQLARRHRRAGQPLISHDAVRQQIGDYASRSRIQTYLGYRVATRAAKGETTAADAPLRKIWFSELNLTMAEYALALLGPRSHAVEGDPLAYDDGRWQDMFLYARALTIAGGSNEIMRNLIAERALGLPREPRGGA